MSPVGCKQKASFRHEAVEIVPVSRVVSTQIQVATPRGYCLERCLENVGLELGVPQEW